MTSTTNKMTTEQLLAVLHTGEATFPTVAASYQEYILGKHADVAKLKQDPASWPPAVGVKLIAELNAAKEISGMLSDQQVEYLQREFTEKFYFDNSAAFVAAATVDLNAVLERQPGVVEKVKAGLVAKITQAWDRATGREDRDRLLAERDAQEDKLAALECSVTSARAAVARFATTPTAQHFGEVQGAIGCVKSALA